MNADKLNEQLYSMMYKIRTVEETLLDLFSKGELSGTTHTSIGQEAIAVGSMSHIEDGDIVFSNHRCHGHYLAYGGPIEPLFAEVMGKSSGLCGGRGGSQHICYKNFRTNGIQGGIVANATGAGLAAKLQGTNQIAVVFLGDGTLGEGLVYEAFNFASLWSIPILFIVENNHYAQSTPVHLGVSGSLLARPKAFGIESDQVESNDVFHLYNVFKQRFDYVRTSKQPFCQIIDTYRLAPHSKGDDFREQSEIESWRKKDPLMIAAKNIEHRQIERIQQTVDQEIEFALEKARVSPPSFFKESTISDNECLKERQYNVVLSERARGVDSLNKSLDLLLSENNHVVVIGEDILDPYGGAFKVTKGLSSAYPERVLTTPISEAGIVGLATGMAMQGMRPIVEIMFGDFLALAADQLLNHASKYRWMYNDQVKIPLVIRTPMGGRRGYGPTHSQSIEKMFLGIPGLTVIAPSHFHDLGKMLYHATMDHHDPVLFIEHKLLYNKELAKIENGRCGIYFVQETNGLFPTFHLSLAENSKPDAVLITYGYNTEIALEAVEYLLIEEELLVDVIVPSLLSPLPIEDIAVFAQECNVVFTLEEGTKRSGWGAEVISHLTELNGRNGRQANTNYFRIAAEDSPIPSSLPLELEVLPSVKQVVQKIKKAIHVI